MFVETEELRREPKATLFVTVRLFLKDNTRIFTLSVLLESVKWICLRTLASRTSAPAKAGEEILYKLPCGTAKAVAFPRPAA
jgi:hypothetical protein